MTEFDFFSTFNAKVKKEQSSEDDGGSLAGGTSDPLSFFGKASAGDSDGAEDPLSFFNKPLKSEEPKIESVAEETGDSLSFFNKPEVSEKEDPLSFFGKNVQGDAPASEEEEEKEDPLSFFNKPLKSEEPKIESVAEETGDSLSFFNKPEVSEKEDPLSFFGKPVQGDAPASEEEEEKEDPLSFFGKPVQGDAPASEEKEDPLSFFGKPVQGDAPAADENEGDPLSFFEKQAVPGGDKEEAGSASAPFFNKPEAADDSGTKFFGEPVPPVDTPTSGEAVDGSAFFVRPIIDGTTPGFTGTGESEAPAGSGVEADKVAMGTQIPLFSGTQQLDSYVPGKKDESESLEKGIAVLNVKGVADSGTSGQQIAFSKPAKDSSSHGKSSPKLSRSNSEIKFPPVGLHKVADTLAFKNSDSVNDFSKHKRSVSPLPILQKPLKSSDLHKRTGRKRFYGFCSAGRVLYVSKGELGKEYVRIANIWNEIELPGAKKEKKAKSGAANVPPAFSSAFYSGMSLREFGNFPGPLKPSTRKDAVKKFLSGRISREKDLDKVVLYKVLSLLVENVGAMPTKDLISIFEEYIEMSPKSGERTSPVEYKIKRNPSFDLRKIEKALRVGDLSSAISHASENGYHELAILLSFGSDDFKSTVETYLKELMNSSEIVSVYLSQILGSLKVMENVDSTGGEWASRVITLLKGKKVKTLDEFPKDTKRIIANYGDFLRKSGNVWAAHVCYLIAGVKPLGRRYILIGYNRKQQKYTPNHMIEPILLTEIYEYALARGNPQFSIPKLSYFKLLHIRNLCDFGMIKEGLLYCNEIMQATEQGKSTMSRYFLSKLKETSLEIDGVLRSSKEIYQSGKSFEFLDDVDGEVFSRKLAKSLMSAIEKGVSLMVSADASETQGRSENTSSESNRLSPRHDGVNTLDILSPRRRRSKNATGHWWSRGKDHKRKKSSNRGGFTIGDDSYTDLGFSQEEGLMSVEYGSGTSSEVSFANTHESSSKSLFHRPVPFGRDNISRGSMDISLGLPMSSETESRKERLSAPPSADTFASKTKKAASSGRPAAVEKKPKPPTTESGTQKKEPEKPKGKESKLSEIFNKSDRRSSASEKKESGNAQDEESVFRKLVGFFSFRKPEASKQNPEYYYDKERGRWVKRGHEDSDDSDSTSEPNIEDFKSESEESGKDENDGPGGQEEVYAGLNMLSNYLNAGKPAEEDDDEPEDDAVSGVYGSWLKPPGATAAQNEDEDDESGTSVFTPGASGGGVSFFRPDGGGEDEDANDILDDFTGVDFAPVIGEGSNLSFGLNDEGDEKDKESSE